MRPTDIVRSPAANSVIELRSKLGETQQQFALRLGSSIGSIARYETNRDPTRRVLARMYLAAIESRHCDLIETFWDLLCVDVGFPGTPFSFPANGRPAASRLRRLSKYKADFAPEQFTIGRQHPFSVSDETERSIDYDRPRETNRISWLGCLEKAC